jgi:hypothetical protein
LATSGDLNLATSEDFYMATDTSRGRRLGERRLGPRRSTTHRCPHSAAGLLAPTGTLAEGLRRRRAPRVSEDAGHSPRLGTSVRRTRRVPKPPIGRFAGTKWTSLICLAWLRSVANVEHCVRANSCRARAPCPGSMKGA